jgi:hypothetical protein
MYYSLLLSFFLFTLSCGSTTKTEIIKKKLVLEEFQFVFEKNDPLSPIVDLFEKGKSIEIVTLENGWSEIASGDRKGLFLYDLEAKFSIKESPTTPTKYKDLDFTISKAGVTNFNLVKIGDKYSYSLVNANTVGVLNRLSRIEEKEIKTVSELPVANESGMQLDFDTVITKLESAGLFSYNKNIATAYPFLWGEALANTKLQNSILKLQNVYHLGESFRYEGGDFCLGTLCEYTAIAIRPREIITITEKEFVKYDKNRKKIKTSTFANIVQNLNKEESCGELYGFLYPDSNAILLTNIRPSECNNPGTNIIFLDNEFRPINKFFIKNKRLSSLLFSITGERFLSRFFDMDNSSQNKIDVVFAATGNKLSEFNLKENENSFYDSEVKKQFKFVDSKLQIKGITDNFFKEENNPIELQSLWLKDNGDDFFSTSKENELYTINIASGKIISYFKFLSNFKFIDLSSGQFALISAADSTNIWGIVDLVKKKIIHFSLNENTFSRIPTKLLKFPGDKKFILYTPYAITKGVIWSNEKGEIFKTEFFENSTAVSKMSFKGNNILQINTDSGLYILPISFLIQNSKKIL